MVKDGRARLSLLVTLATFAMVVLGDPTAASAGTLDQQQTSASGSLGLTSTQSVAQTFTAGVTGRVDQVDLEFSKTGIPPATVTVEIRNAPGGIPGTSVLASDTISTSSIGFAQAFLSLPFGTPAPVTAGQAYAIVIYSPGAFSNDIAVAYQNTDVYSGGSTFEDFENDPPGAAWVPYAPADLAFKTYALPPLPAVSTPGSTGQRAAALASCRKRARKHHWSHERLKRCKKNAALLPL